MTHPQNYKVKGRKMRSKADISLSEERQLIKAGIIFEQKPRDSDDPRSSTYIKMSKRRQKIFEARHKGQAVNKPIDDVWLNWERDYVN